MVSWNQQGERSYRRGDSAADIPLDTIANAGRGHLHKTVDRRSQATQWQSASSIWRRCRIGSDKGNCRQEWQRCQLEHQDHFRKAGDSETNQRDDDRRNQYPKPCTAALNQLQRKRYAEYSQRKRQSVGGTGGVPVQ